MFVAILTFGVVGLVVAFLATRLIIREWSKAIAKDYDDIESDL